MSPTSNVRTAAGPGAAPGPAAEAAPGARPRGLLGRDVTDRLPAAAPGIVELDAADQAVWERAERFLHVRDNDAHTLYAYGIASALLARVPAARPEIVLPAILLHDTGWSTVPEDQVLGAIAPGGGRVDLVRAHELAGARIAREILTELGRDPVQVDEIVQIVDGHDSRRQALSANDACVKDADKLWRLTPHGLATVQRWFGLTPQEALRLVSSRTHDHLFTEAGRSMARVLGAVASMALSPQLAELSAHEGLA